MVSLLIIQPGRSPPALLEQNMYILAIIRNLIAGFVHKHLLHCSGALFRFISVVTPCWAHAVKGLWKWGACQYSHRRVIVVTLVKT